MSSLRSLPALVRDRFQAAHETRELTFYPTQVSIVKCDNIPFQIRFSPSLANKPKSQPQSHQSESQSRKPFDTFAHPPPGLFITGWGPSHNLILNKFPVIPSHFILATKQFKQQSDLLEEDDLEAAYQCLKAYEDNGEQLFGFFNSGEHSGASQAHRHVQFLPVEDMKCGLSMGLEWDVLANKLVDIPGPDLPFTYFSSAVPNDPSPQQLYRIYSTLHDQALLVYQFYASAAGEIIHPIRRKLQSPMSYNLGLTDRAMVLCPRISEGTRTHNVNGCENGFVALNGSILGGTLVVKGEQEWNSLRGNGVLLKKTLGGVGVPPNAFSKDPPTIASGAKY